MESMAGTQSSVTLVVKTPNQRVDDIEVDCLLDWTVEKLKTHLAKVYPTKPARSSQKIIYSGKLLADNCVLKDVLFENDGQHRTVHLVCTPSAADLTQATMTQTTVPTEQPTRVQATVPEVTSSTSATTSSTSQPDGLRHRTPHQAQPPFPHYNMFHPNFYPNATAQAAGQHATTHAVNQHTMTPGTQPHIHPNAAYQFAGHHAHVQAQYLARIHWMHHMSQMMHGMAFHPMQPPLPYPQQAGAAAVTTQAPATIPQPAAAAPPPPPPAAAAAHQAAAPQAPERREGEAPRNNVVMNANAGGGVMQDGDDDEDDLPRDWLDHIYTAVRLLMLLSIFWFYSSAERLFVMAVAMFIVWLLQSGWLNLNRVQRNRVRDGQENANEADDQLGDDSEDSDEDEDAEETDSTVDDDDTDANTTSDSGAIRPEQPGFFVVCYNFVTTFFISLVPQGPQPIGQP